MVLAENLNELILILILIILQIITIYFAVKIGKILGSSRFWWLIIAALGIIIVRRITDILILFNFIEYSEIINQINNLYIPLIFWIFFGLGMFDLYQKVKINKQKK